MVYIDGFNLYYGALRGGPFKWLNIERGIFAFFFRTTIYSKSGISLPRPSGPAPFVNASTCLL